MANISFLKTLLVALFLLYGFLACKVCHAQTKSVDSTHTSSNPIIFAENFLGYAGGSAGGLGFGFTLNFQPKRNLFTLRWLVDIGGKAGADYISPFTAFPFLSANNSLEEFGALYGRRFIDGGHAYSFSAGVSYNNFKHSVNENYRVVRTRTEYLGFPVEANIQWFKSRKKRFRIITWSPLASPPLSEEASH